MLCFPYVIIKGKISQLCTITSGILEKFEILDATLINLFRIFFRRHLIDGVSAVFIARQIHIVTDLQQVFVQL